MVKKKIGMMVLASALLSGSVVLPMANNQVVAETNVSDVEAFLKKDMEVATAQIPFTQTGNIYSMVLPDAEMELANLFLSVDGIEPDFWENVDILNRQIRQINTDYAIEQDVAKKKVIYEEQLIPKLEVLHTFIESGEEKYRDMMKRMDEDSNYADYLYDLGDGYRHFEYTYINQYFDAQRLLIYAYQELYKYEFDESIDKENPSYEVERKISEVSQYLTMNKMINTFLFDQEAYAEMTQYY